MSEFKAETNVKMIAWLIGGLCLAGVLLFWPNFSSQAHASPMAQDAPAVETVPTLPPGTPTATSTTQATPTATATTNPTATPTATPGPLGVDTVPSSDALYYRFTYHVRFTNNTIELIHGGKVYFVVPLYATLNLTGSGPGWSCPNGTTAGKTCTFVWGDIPPTGALNAASVNDTKEATFVLDVKKDQIPATVKSLAFDVIVADGSGKVFSTFAVNSQLPGRLLYNLFLPLGRR